METNGLTLLFKSSELKEIEKAGNRLIDALKELGYQEVTAIKTHYLQHESDDCWYALRIIDGKDLKKASLVYGKLDDNTHIFSGDCVYVVNSYLWNIAVNVVRAVKSIDGAAISFSSNLDVSLSSLSFSKYKDIKFYIAMEFNKRKFMCAPSVIHKSLFIHINTTEKDKEQKKHTVNELEFIADNSPELLIDIYLNGLSEPQS